MKMRAVMTRSLFLITSCLSLMLMSFWVEAKKSEEAIDRQSCRYEQEPAPGPEGQDKTQDKVTFVRVKLGNFEANLCSASVECDIQGGGAPTSSTVVCEANEDGSCPKAPTCAKPGGVVKEVRKSTATRDAPEIKRKGRKPGPSSTGASS